MLGDLVIEDFEFSDESTIGLFCCYLCLLALLTLSIFYEI